MRLRAGRRVLVVGGSGQLGGAVLRSIEKTEPGWAVRATTRDELDLARPVGPQLASLSLGSSDAVVNCAAFHNVDEAEVRPELAFRINAYAVRELGRYCERNGAHFVHISTDYVFGGVSRRAPYHEADATAPLNVYGASKLAGEALIDGIERRTVCRVASLFGRATSNGRKANFVDAILAKSLRQAPLSVVGNRIMSPTFAGDAAQAIVQLIRQERFGLYHVVNSGTASWWEFAGEILSMAGLHGYPVTRRSDDVATDPPPVRPIYSALDNAKCADATGWRLRPWREALGDYMAGRAVQT